MQYFFILYTLILHTLELFFTRVAMYGTILNPAISPKIKHYLPLDGTINMPIYLVWGCWVQLNSIFFADHIIFNNGYVKHAHTRQRMTNNNNNNKRKQV